VLPAASSLSCCQLAAGATATRPPAPGPLVPSRAPGALATERAHERREQVASGRPRRPGLHWSLSLSLASGIWHPPVFTVFCLLCCFLSSVSPPGSWHSWSPLARLSLWCLAGGTSQRNSLADAQPLWPSCVASLAMNNPLLTAHRASARLPPACFQMSQSTLKTSGHCDKDETMPFTRTVRRTGSRGGGGPPPS
jgi:hypothetical protein